MLFWLWFPPVVNWGPCWLVELGLALLVLGVTAFVEGPLRALLEACLSRQLLDPFIPLIGIWGGGFFWGWGFPWGMGFPVPV